MDNFKTTSFHLSKERKKAPSLAPALVGLVRGAVFGRPSEQVGFFPSVYRRDGGSVRTCPKSHCEEMRPPSFELRAPDSEFGVLSPAHKRFLHRFLS